MIGTLSVSPMPIHGGYMLGSHWAECKAAEPGANSQVAHQAQEGQPEVDAVQGPSRAAPIGLILRAAHWACTALFLGCWWLWGQLKVNPDNGPGNAQ